MADSLMRPIFPPTQPFIEGEALKAGLSVLDQATQDRLEADAARLSQVSAGVGILLGAALGFENAAAATLARQFVEVSRDFPPDYREYLNQLFGAAASVLALGGGGHNTESVQELDAPKLHIAPAADEQGAREILSGDEGTSAAVGDNSMAPEDGGEDAAEEQANFVPLSSEVQFIRYDKAPQFLRRFLGEVLTKDLVKEMSPEECAVCAHLLIEDHMRADIFRFNARRKQEQHDRLRRVFGLNRPAVTVDQLSAEIGLTGSSVHTGMVRVREQLKEIFSDDKKGKELLERARQIVEHDKNAVFIDERDWVDQGDSPVLSGIEPDAKGGDPAESSGHAGQVAEASDISERELKKYEVSPVNMRNFVSRILPAGYEDRLKVLHPSALSLLASQLLEHYRGIEKPGDSEERRGRRIAIIERWIGLYENPLDINELAQRMVITAQQIDAQIDSVVNTFNDKVPEDMRKQYYAWAASQS